MIGNDSAINSSISTNVLFKEVPEVQSRILKEVKHYDKEIGKVNSEKDKLSKRLSNEQLLSKEKLQELLKESKLLLHRRKELVEKRKMVPNLYRSNQIKKTSLKFVNSINKYLNKFTPNVEIMSVNPVYTREKGFKLANFEIKINGRIKIRDSVQESSFFRLKNYLEEIEDINDYSKKFHHSNSQYISENIDFQELTIFVKRTIKILDKI